MKRIQSIDDLIKSNIIRLKCGKKEGTAFLIDDDKAITARHCVTEYFETGEEINLDFLNLEREDPLSINAEVWEENQGTEKCPIVILKFNEKIEEQHLSVGVLDISCANKEQMKTFGYPSAARDSGFPLMMTLNDTNTGTQIGDANWYFSDSSKLVDFEGYSGSPVVFAQYMVGVILKEKTLNKAAFSLDAVSNDKLQEFYQNNKIEYTYLDYEDLKRKEEACKRINTVSSVPIGIEVNCNNYERNMIVKSSVPEELLKEIEEENLKKLDYINELKIQGKDDEAWELLRTSIKSLLNSVAPNNKVLARFYYLEAIWYLEDNADGSNAQKYYTKAIEHDATIDTRIYCAKKRLQEGTCCNVLEILGNLDSVAILNTYLQICVIQDKVKEAKKAYDECIVEPNHSTFYMMALINILNKNYVKSNEFIDLALEEINDSPIYMMMKGVILYWECIPDDIIAKHDLLPVMFEPRIVHISDNALTKFPVIIGYYEQALRLAQQAKNQNLQRLIFIVWMDSLSISQKYKIEIDRLADELLSIEHLNPLAITWKYKQNQDLSQYDYEEFERSIKGDCDNRIGTIIALVNVCLAKQDKKSALKYLSKYKYEFNRLNVLEYWYDLQIAATDDLDDLEEIENSISTCNMDDEYKKRFKGVILERKNCGEDLILYAKKLYTETNQRIDLINLIRSCDKFKRWKDMESYSSIWYEKFDDELALISGIKAVLMQYEFKKCQDKIIEYEKKYGHNNEVLFYKSQLLKICGKYEEALEAADQLWNEIKTEQILILMAEILYLDGKEEEMIFRLKEGISAGIRTSKVYIMLADNLKGKKNREAKKYAKKAYMVSNNDKQIMLWCINVLFDLGESAEGGELLQKLRIEEMQVDTNNNQVLRLATIKEVREFIEKARQQRLNQYKSYVECKIPYHLFFDKQSNLSYAEIFLESWANNGELHYSMIYSTFGSRRLSEINIKENIGEEIILDYSTILLLFKLELLQCVLDSFCKVWIAGNIFVVLGQEVSKTLVTQPDMLEERISIKNACENIGLVYHDLPSKEEWINYDDGGDNLWQVIRYIEAKKEKLVWVEDILEKDMFNNIRLFEEMKDAAINTNEILRVLVEKKIITEESFEKMKKYSSNCRKRKVQEIVKYDKKISLLVDFAFLEMLYANKCLDQVAANCELHVFCNVFDSVNEEEKRKNHLLSVKECIEDIKDVLKDYKEKGKIYHIPQMDNNIEKGNLFLELKECMLFSIERELPFVCDDRMVNSYSLIGNHPSLSTVDIVEKLYFEKKITHEVYCGIYKMLLDKTVCYIIPSFEYMRNAFSVSREVRGEIDENIYMISARKYLHRVTNPNSVLHKTKLEHVYLPEILEYMYNLQNSCTKLLKWIWEQDRNLLWKELSSKWLLNYYSEFGYYSLFLKGDRKNILKYQTTRIADFIFKGICEIPEKENKETYYRWLFGWLQHYLVHYPDMEELVVEWFCEFVENFIQKAEQTKHREIIKVATVQLILDAIKCMPDKFGTKIMSSPQMKHVLDKYTYEIIALDDKTVIERETFWQWIEQAIQAGKNKEIKRDYRGRTFKVSFVKDAYHVQGFLFNWNENDIEKNMGYSIKGAYLYCKDKLTRMKGFNHLTNFLPDEFINEVAHKMEMERNVKDIESIIEVLESKGDFWKEKLNYIFDIQYDNIFDFEELFPKHKECFESILPWYDKELWKDKIIKQKKDIIEVLELLIKLPIGAENEMGKIIADLKLSANEVKNLELWILRKDVKVMNPIELLNLAYFFYSRDDKKTEKFLLNIFEVEEEQMKLYIGLLKYGWIQLKFQAEFAEMSDSVKLVYCYYFAGEVYTKIVSTRLKRRLKYNIQDINQWLYSITKRLNDDENQLNIILDEDVMSPTCINVFRLTYTGFCNFIVKKKYVIRNFNNIQSRMENLYQIKDSPDLFLEMNLSDKKRSNYLDAPYTGRLLELVNTTFKINGILKVEVDYDVSTEVVLNDMEKKPELSINDFAFLYVISKDIIKEKWIENIKRIINSFSILVLQEKIVGKFKCILAMTEQMPDDFRQVCCERFQKELKIVVEKANEEQFEEIISMLEIYCMTVNNENPFDEYLDILEEITRDRVIRTSRIFIERLMDIRFELEPESWERVEKLLYHFIW